MSLRSLVLAFACLSGALAAQDLTNTWLKATLVTRLLPNGPDLGLIGGGPDLDAKAPSLTRKVPFYLQVQTQLDPSTYQVEAFTLFEGELAPTCSFGLLQLSDGGVFTIEDLYVPVLAKTLPESGPIFGYVEGDFAGRLRAKFDGEGSVTKLVLATTAGLVDDALIVEGETVVPHTGAARVRAKLVAPSKLPPVSVTVKIGPGD